MFPFWYVGDALVSLRFGGFGVDGLAPGSAHVSTGLRAHS